MNTMRIFQQCKSICTYLPMCLCGEKKIKLSFFTILLFAFNLSKAATVDTVSIYSNAMHKDFKCVVVKPEILQQRPIALPVVYLLHGYGGDFSNWIKKVPAIKDYADKYRILIVCPDGDNSSWYFDSPVDSSMRYETYVGKEVPEYIDAHYHTIKNRTARAITGLSMGGHGAFFLAFRHANFFGACASMSGLMDLYSAKNKYELMQRIGDTIQHADNWKNYSVINVIENHPSDSLAIIFDCGMDDPFHTDNKRLHEKMLKLKIAHDYIERPGNHNWNYWANSVEYQLMFFRKYFDAMKSNWQ
jgi:S-formylglutathione hydrolase FrmB